MEQESQPYRFKISLRLTHPVAELCHCTSEFGMEPLRQWKVGDARTTPRGNPLEGLRSNSYWTVPLAISEKEDLEAALARIAQWLGEHDSFMLIHADSGGSAALFIGFFLESFNSGFLLEPSLLAKYSTLGVALDFDMYGPDDEPVAP
ncbi:DUF4279 domain-containing protein [Lysobacter avium]|uniref:DUF4279 domain-containing protein n=1 Tax=Novilysobacter avium TaxID=2781023 RepID=A0A7S6UKW1_9GAMM|nr:DUF4279 domain-containing protein [Lysobacter avium]